MVFEWFLIKLTFLDHLLDCSATRPKIWYLKPEVNPHEQVKRFLNFRFVLTQNHENTCYLGLWKILILLCYYF